MKTTFFIVIFTLIIGFVVGNLLAQEVIKNQEIVKAGKTEGTLLVPQAPKAIPVVIIIAGSGPTDRDGNSIAGVSAQPYKLLAEDLAKNNIASLRYDKRGVGKSIIEGMKEDSLRFDHYITDAVDWIEFLSKDKRFSSIIILGHSEGSLIGMIAAQNPKVSKYISLAGAGRRIDEIIVQQLKDQKQPENIVTDISGLFAQLKEGKLIEKPNPLYFSLFRPSVQPYMISWLKYNPADEIKKLTKPVLLIQGTTDIQVTENEALLLKNANSKASYLLIQQMNHVLKTSTADRAENIATYSKTDLPLAEGLVSGIVKFIK